MFRSLNDSLKSKENVFETHSSTPSLEVKIAVFSLSSNLETQSDKPMQTL